MHTESARETLLREVKFEPLLRFLAIELLCKDPHRLEIDLRVVDIVTGEDLIADYADFIGIAAGATSKDFLKSKFLIMFEHEYQDGGIDAARVMVGKLVAHHKDMDARKKTSHKKKYSIGD